MNCFEPLTLHDRDGRDGHTVLCHLPAGHAGDHEAVFQRGVTVVWNTAAIREGHPAALVDGGAA